MSGSEIIKKTSFDGTHQLELLLPFFRRLYLLCNSSPFAHTLTDTYTPQLQNRDVLQHAPALAIIRNITEKTYIYRYAELIIRIHPSITGTNVFCGLTELCVPIGNSHTAHIDCVFICLFLHSLVCSVLCSIIALIICHMSCHYVWIELNLEWGEARRLDHWSYVMSGASLIPRRAPFQFSPLTRLLRCWWQDEVMAGREHFIDADGTITDSIAMWQCAA